MIACDTYNTINEAKQHNTEHILGDMRYIDIHSSQLLGSLQVGFTVLYDDGVYVIFLSIYFGVAPKGD